MTTTFGVAVAAVVGMIFIGCITSVCSSYYNILTCCSEDWELMMMTVVVGHLALSFLPDLV